MQQSKHLPVSVDRINHESCVLFQLMCFFSGRATVVKVQAARLFDPKTVEPHFGFNASNLLVVTRKRN